MLCRRQNILYILACELTSGELMKQWRGVFPATTTQFGGDESLDVRATQKVVDALIKDGVDGIICMGTVGENCSLTAQEKRTVLAAVKEVTAGRVPVLSGVAEYTTALAAQFARDAEKAGIDGLMVLAGDGLQGQSPRADHALPCRGRCYGAPDHDLQQPDLVRRGRHGRHVGRSRGCGEHRRHQGILGGHAARDRPASRVR